MIWVSWRQDRARLLGLAVLFVVLAAGYVAMGAGMRGSLSTVDLPGCFSGAPDPRCGDWPALIAFVHNYAQLLLTLLPAALGMFLGAPVVATELEHHTFRFTWTQSVTRGRWLGSKLLLGGAFSVAYGLVFAAAYAWWHAPATRFDGWFPTFDFGLVSFPATCLFGYALGVAGGAVFRRTLAGAAVALVGFLPVIVVVKNLVRPRLLSPVLTEQIHFGDLAVGTQVFRDTAGKIHGYDETLALAGIPRPPIPGMEPVGRLAAAGFTRLYPVQPAGRFWTLQLCEAGLFVLLAALCVAVAFWWVRRRLA